MKVGFAVSDITPELGIYLTGYGRPERLATSVHSPLTAVAMVLSGETEVAVIGLDWCFVDWSLTQDIRRGINEAAGIPEQNILLCCSHTHSAPHTTYMRTLGRVAVDPENRGVEYVKKSIPAIADAVLRAKASLRECRVGFAAGKTKTGVSRRGMNEEGCVTGFIGDPDLMYDDNMTTAHFIDSETGGSLGVLVHCSAHNTSMGGLDTSISSDWCGVMKKRVFDRYQVPVIFLNGAFGDVGPRSNRWVEGENYRGFAAGGGGSPVVAAEVGYRAATDALRLLEGIRDYRSDLPLASRTAMIRLPQSIIMSQEEARQILQNYDSHAGDDVEPPVDYQLAKIAIETWKKPLQPIFEFEQTVIALGPLALAPFPFEMFSIFSLRLRRFGPFEYTLLCSNTNGRNAYLPDRGSIACGGYEVDCRKTIRPYVLDPEAGDLAVVQTLKSLREISK